MGLFVRLHQHEEKCGRGPLAAALFYGHGDGLLSCQVEQLKEELNQSQSEKEELRQRANELQREASAVRDVALCSRFRSFLLESFCPPPG